MIVPINKCLALGNICTISNVDQLTVSLFAELQYFPWIICLLGLLKVQKAILEKPISNTQIPPLFL